MALTVVDLVIITLVAFVPALIYALWIRNTEIYRREPMGAIELVFVYGATIALGAAFILELIVAGFAGLFISNELLNTLLLALIFAPIIEEFTKATGVFTVRRRLTEPENGLVYGAASGLGFAAGENVLYFTAAFLQGVDVFIVTAVARTLTSMLLHASTTSITGFGISRSACLKAWFGRPASWFPYYLAAVGIHSFFNLLASLGDITQSNAFVLIGLVLSFILVVLTVTYVRRKIKTLDRANVDAVIRCE